MDMLSTNEIAAAFTELISSQNLTAYYIPLPNSDHVSGSWVTRSSPSRTHFLAVVNLALLSNILVLSREFSFALFTFFVGDEVCILARNTCLGRYGPRGRTE